MIHNIACCTPPQQVSQSTTSSSAATDSTVPDLTVFPGRSLCVAVSFVSTVTFCPVPSKCVTQILALWLTALPSRQDTKGSLSLMQHRGTFVQQLSHY